MTPGEYIINVAISAFNRQMGTAYNDSYFDIVTISEPVIGSENERRCVFELQSFRYDDELKIKLWFKPDVFTHIGDYVVQDSDSVYTTGTEYYVAECKLSVDLITSYSASINHDCPQLKSLADKLLNNTLLREYGDELLLEDGSFILLEQ